MRRNFQLHELLQQTRRCLTFFAWPCTCRLARGGQQPKSADQQRGRAHSQPQGRLLLRAGDMGWRMADAVLGLTETATGTLQQAVISFLFSR